MNELAQLEAELQEVKSSELEYLPKYGYSLRSDIIELIKEEIEELKCELATESYDYSDIELEHERTQLCYSQGISRYC